MRKYNRVLLKLSGESLAGSKTMGIDFEKVLDICSEIKEVAIPEDITSIGAYTFSGCSSITSVSIPNSVTSIGFGAFSGCANLKCVNIPSSITSIDRYAFKDCNSLEKTIINSLSAWCKIAFDYNIKTSNPLYYSHHLYIDENTEITELVLPEDVTKIGYNTFAGCTYLTSVVIPANIE